MGNAAANGENSVVSQNGQVGTNENLPGPSSSGSVPPPVNQNLLTRNSTNTWLPSDN